MNRRVKPLLLLALIALLGGVLTGCNADDNGKGSGSNGGLPDNSVDADAEPLAPGETNVQPSPRVDKLELESFPAAINLDDDPGADGIQLKLRLFNLQEPPAQRLQRGEIEFVLYEGRIPDDQLGAAEPFYIWRYNSAAKLNRHGRNTLVGWQYEMVLAWNKDHSPETRAITVIARLLRPGKPPLYARPVHITVSGV